MEVQSEFKNELDANGNPAGGWYRTTGINIQWQNGPLWRDGEGQIRQVPNGAFVENVVDAAIKRIEHYQSTKFKCRENAIALTHLETALLWLNKRTQDREKRGVEGTHTV
jgi:hypothetical protein